MDQFQTFDLLHYRKYFAHIIFFVLVEHIFPFLHNLMTNMFCYSREYNNLSSRYQLEDSVLKIASV